MTPGGQGCEECRWSGIQVVRYPGVQVVRGVANSSLDPAGHTLVTTAYS